MDVSFLFDYVNVVILGICLMIGYVLKEAFPGFKNRYIPAAALLAGLAIAIITNYETGITVDIVLSGMISGLASTGFYEMLRNLINKNDKTEGE